MTGGSLLTSLNVAQERRRKWGEEEGKGGGEKGEGEDGEEEGNDRK